MHESWHRIQTALGFPMVNSTAEHLDALEGRYLFVLELRALAAALRAEGEPRRARVREIFSSFGPRRVPKVRQRTMRGADAARCPRSPRLLLDDDDPAR